MHLLNRRLISRLLCLRFRAVVLRGGISDRGLSRESLGIKPLFSLIGSVVLNGLIFAWISGPVIWDDFPRVRRRAALIFVLGET